MLTLPALAQDSQHKVPQTPSTDVASRYPAGSIQSVETADRALAEAESERAAIEARYAEDERTCYTKFFANNCKDAAHERRRVALARLRPVEVEANSFKRHAKVAERDKALAEKNEQAEKELARREQEMAQRAAQQPEPKDRPQRQEPQAKSGSGANTKAAAQTAKTAKPAPPVRKPGNGPDRVQQHEAKLKRLQEEDAANAQKRAENIAAYERKVREAEERQREIAARKLEKEKEKEKERANK